MQQVRRDRSGWRSRGGLLLAAGLLTLALLTLLAAACEDDKKDAGDGSPADGETPADAGPIDYGTLGGEIRIDGSSTVFPIAEAVAEEFSKVSNTRVNVAFSGTGAGFEKFCRGETQVSDASRPIKDDEIQACADNGIDDIVEIQVAIDALTVMVNPDNGFVECMTVKELATAFSRGGVSTWADINPDWPDDTIEFFFPGVDSGTFDYFVEAIVEEVDENGTHRGGGEHDTASEDDNVLALGIENDPDGLGYFGFAYFLEAGQSLKAVQVDGGAGCVEPSFEAALDGSYTPLSRPLFMYTREEFLANNPEVLGLLYFTLDNAETLVPEVGYINLPDDLLAEQLGKLEPFLP